MGELIAMDDAYRTWIADLKSCYRQLQIRAVVSVDSISPNLPQVVEILIKVPWGDHRFMFSADAFSVVSGRPSNGRLDWVAADGRRLREVQEEWRE